MKPWRHLSFRMGAGLIGGLIVISFVLVSDRTARNAVDNRHSILRLENEMFRAGVDTREYIRIQDPSLLEVIDQDLGRAEQELARLPPRQQAVFGALLEGYRSAWRATVEAIRARGIGDGKGSLGQLQQSARALEEIVTKLESPRIRVHVLRARQAEKDYILEQQPASVKNLYASLWALQDDFRLLKKPRVPKQALSQASTTYQRDFESLVARLQDIEDRARVLAESRLRMARALRRVSTLESASAESRTRAANLMLLVGSVTAMVFSILLAVSLLRPLSSIRLAAMKLAEGRTDLEIRPGGGAELEAVGQALSDAGREIGRRMEAQSAAAEAQALARQVLDAQEHALIVLDRDLRVKMMNSSVYALRGQGFAVEVGCSLLEGLPEALQAGAEQRLQGALEGRVTRAKDELIIDASGQSRWYAATNVPLRDADGNIKGVVKSMLDVTSRKLHEMELTEARTRAEAGQAAKSRFLNNISHEMRTPLNGILGMAQVLDVGTLDIATREAIDLMHGSAERLLSMIDGVIEYSEMEHDHESYATEPYRIDTLLQEIQQQYAGETERSKTTLSVRSEIHTPLHLPVRALQAVLRELLENALRYAFGAPIEITAELVELAEGRQVKLTVADEGPGIGPEKRDTIFEAFVQGDSSRQKAEGGLGIGLARVRQIAERIGASVTLESEPGQGCAIALQFAAGFVEASTAPEPNRRPPTPKPDVRVLVAEDNPVNQKVAQRMLEQLGVTPEIVPNGEEAVRAVQRTSFDLVLMDLQMPVLDGLEATKQIRALLPLDDQPSIVALTANNRPADKRACSEVGMDAFLEKPVRRKDLVRVLEQFST